MFTTARLTSSSRTISAFALLLLVQGGCKDKNPEVEAAAQSGAKADVAKTDAKPKPEPEPEAPADGSPERSTRELQLEPRDPASLDPRMKIEGDVRKAVSWTDANGENVAVFATKANPHTNGRQLFAAHYVSTEGAPKLLRDVEDGVEACELDVSAEFRDAVLEVTDLDNDGTGELTFAYTFNCAGDVSPATQRLFILEDGNEFVINGRETIVLEGETLGGDKEMESFKSAPAPFVAHANAAWEELAKRSRERFAP